MDSIPVHNTKGKFYIPENKFDYFFGRVISDTYNTNRSISTQRQLNSIGINDTPAGRETIANTIKKSVADPSNITKTETKIKDGITYNLERREMLLVGPNGIRKLEAGFEIYSDGTRKLTTIIVKGGK